MLFFFFGGTLFYDDPGRRADASVLVAYLTNPIVSSLQKVWKLH